MRGADFLLPALRQFRTQKLQALLITVAIALGVGVIVAAAAQVEAANRLAASFTNSLMSREILIRSALDGPQTVSLSDGPVRRVGLVEEEPVVFTLQDLEDARQALPGVDYVYFELFHGLSRGADAGFAFVDARAVTQDYLLAADLELLGGSFFATADYGTDERILLATPALLDEFGLTAADVGSSVQLDDAAYRIVGVVQQPEPVLGPELMAFVPLTEALLQRIRGREIKAAVRDPDRLAAARAEEETFASNRWGRGVNVEAGLPGQAARDDSLLLFIAGFASLGLLVAALNIMNLMLARVLRRQRDIGIIRSIGATRTVVALQVLGEALALGALGGLLGLAAAFGLLRAYNSYLLGLVPGLSVDAFRLSLPWGSALIGVGLALLISVLFGLYPAVVAARIQPLATLRQL
jgi:putative ABC transport system permease protein